MSVDTVQTQRAVSAERARAVTDGETILATMEIPASPERVFSALTTNETERWWGSPDTYRVTEWKADVRVGGIWSLVVRHLDGSLFPAGGKYLEVDAPGRIVQTRKYDWDCPGLGRRDTMVAYRLDPVAAGTRVTVRHDGFGGLRGAADEHAAGWERFLGWLAAYLSSGGQAKS